MSTATLNPTDKTPQNQGGLPDAGLSDYEAVDASNLRIGTRLRIPIYDEHDVLLLAKGQLVSENFMHRLASRGIQSVKVHSSELSRVYAGKPAGTSKVAPPSREGVYCDASNESTNQLDGMIKQGGHLGLPPQGEAFASSLTSRGNSSYREEDWDALVETQEVAVDQVEEVYELLVNGHDFDSNSLALVADSALESLTNDFDLFNCLGVNPQANRYPMRHSMHVSMLSIAVGTRLGLDRQTLKELSMGCLIHDAGMMQINDQLYNSKEQLDRVKFLEITKHPVTVFDMMKSMQRIPSRSAFVAYQIHERCNGQGYPRRRTGSQIHFLSKVAAVADNYIALVSPRPHRPAMMPYKAMEMMIRGVQTGLYDPLAVRALLQTISLFPIGSYIELSDGRVGKVIRSNNERYERPIVSVWKTDSQSDTPDTVNLLETPDLKIQRPLAALPAPKPASKIATADSAASFDWE